MKAISNFPDTTLDRHAWEMAGDYRRIQPGEPFYDLIKVHQDAGRWVCDSTDHNAPEGCTNPNCFKFVQRGRIKRSQKEKDRLKGVQLSFGGGPLTYRADSGNGSLVLCDRHLDLRRGRGEQWKLTGEAFEAKLCDDCEEGV